MRLVVALTCLIATLASAQETPVTVAEGDRAIKRAHDILKNSLKLPAASFSVTESNATMTRDQLIDRLHRLHLYARPKYQERNKPVARAMGNSVTGLSANRVRQLSVLASYGIVKLDGILANPRKNQYTAKEFGRILGDAIGRILELSHVLDPKYSPENMPG